jgi:hypothetical protein
MQNIKHIHVAPAVNSSNQNMAKKSSVRMHIFTRAQLFLKTKKLFYFYILRFTHSEVVHCSAPVGQSYIPDDGLRWPHVIQNIVACLLRAITVKPMQTAIARESLC